MTSPVPPAWAHLPFFSKDWPRIAARLAADRRVALPPPAQRFAALFLTGPSDVRAVILGQDPYPTPGHAHGLAFSVEPDVTPLPRSLSNIYREMRDDLGSAPKTGDLRHLARQGVLLLNTVLTVPAGEPRGHSKIGWQSLAAEVLGEISQQPTAFILWGRDAWVMAPVTEAGHLIIRSTHPSPLGAANSRAAHPAFFGSRPFSRVNRWLSKMGKPPIDWIGD